METKNTRETSISNFGVGTKTAEETSWFSLLKEKPKNHEQIFQEKGQKNAMEKPQWRNRELNRLYSYWKYRCSKGFKSTEQTQNQVTTEW